MVRRKDAPDDKDWLKRYLERYNEDNPIVATRYYVVEVTPSEMYWRGDGHGGSERCWTNQTEVRVSEYSQSKRDCEKFVDLHEPDEGKSLAIRTQHKRRSVTERWV